MQSCVYQTDPSWLFSLEQTGVRHGINFWRSDPRNLALQPGDLLYFKLRRSADVGGRAYFREQLQLPIAEAWKQFGKGNGAASRTELDRRVRDALGEVGHSLNCIIVDGLEILPPGARPRISSEDFPRSIRNYKFFKVGSLPSIEAVFSELVDLPAMVGAEAEASAQEQFDPQFISTTRAKAMRAICVRRGQPRFRRELLEAYDGKCCVTGETATEILEAAHIHPYRGADTDRVSNGLLLRTDLHTLFDFGLWTLEDSFAIRLAREMRSSRSYAQYEGSHIAVPKATRLHPSKAALRFHRESIFEKICRHDS